MQHLFYKLSALFIMLMCVSATLQAEIVHHEVCKPTYSTRGFTRECWEDTETNRFYSDADCTQELVGLALAKAVTYAKLPENPVIETDGFGVEEQDFLYDETDDVPQFLDLNWSASTTYTHNESDSHIRFAHFTVRGTDVRNARMVCFFNKESWQEYDYTVTLYVNDEMVFYQFIFRTQEYKRLIVIPLSDLKEGDDVKFMVERSNDGQEDNNPAFLASLEYNFNLCSHEYPDGSAICSLCGYVKEHTHAYNETGTCSLCGAPDPTKKIWTIVDGGNQLVVEEDISIQKLFYTRNFPKANQWQALYVPFEMQPSDWEDKFDVAAISNFHEYINENGETEKVELEARYVKNGKLLPNIPYLIRAKEAGEQTIVLNDVILKKTEVQSISCCSTERRYTFTGTYEAIVGLKWMDFIYVSGGNLCKADDDTDALEAMRWYLTIEDRESMTYTPSAAFAKSINIRLIGEEEATGIEDIKVVSSPASYHKASEIYSITGVKLAKPQKGINIINGKKVLVK